MKWWARIKRRPFFIKLRQWEYWPSLAFYWPLIFYLPWLALRARHPAFFTAANPGIYSGGLGLESKFETVQMLPAHLRPRTIRVRPATPLPAVMSRLDSAGIGFPLIAKPDVGFRGLLVKKIKTREELAAYLERYPADFLLQEFLTAPGEFGVLYYRLPGTERGRITSLTLKSFLAVTGDGRSTVRELVETNDRALLQLDRLMRDLPDLLDHIPAAGVRVPLGQVGNHSKGTRFIDGGHLIDETLERTFDNIAGQIDGYYYGRFDVKCNSLADLKAGRNLSIIELNGICSEPTHLYDPDGSYWNSLAAILKHWRLIWRIATANHRRGAAYGNPREVLSGLFRVMRHNRRLEKY